MHAPFVSPLLLLLPVLRDFDRPPSDEESEELLDVTLIFALALDLLDDIEPVIGRLGTEFFLSAEEFEAFSEEETPPILDLPVSSLPSLLSPLLLPLMLALLLLLFSLP